MRPVKHRINIITYRLAPHRILHHSLVEHEGQRTICQLFLSNQFALIATYGITVIKYGGTSTEEIRISLLTLHLSACPQIGKLSTTTYPTGHGCRLWASYHLTSHVAIGHQNSCIVKTTAQDTSRIDRAGCHGTLHTYALNIYGTITDGTSNSTHIRTARDGTGRIQNEVLHISTTGNIREETNLIFTRKFQIPDHMSLSVKGTTERSLLSCSHRHHGNAFHINVGSQSSRSIGGSRCHSLWPPKEFMRIGQVVITIRAWHHIVSLWLTAQSTETIRIRVITLRSLLCKQKLCHSMRSAHLRGYTQQEEHSKQCRKSLDLFHVNSFCFVLLELLDCVPRTFCLGKVTPYFSNKPNNITTILQWYYKTGRSTITNSRKHRNLRDIEKSPKSRCLRTDTWILHLSSYSTYT